MNIRDNDGDTPILVCEQENTFNILAKAGADTKAKNTIGEGILEKAIEDANEELIKFLIENGHVDNPHYKFTPGDISMSYDNVNYEDYDHSNEE